MTQYTRKVTTSGITQYRDVTKNIIVKGESLDPAIKEELDLGAEGVVFDSEGITSDHSTQVDADGHEVKPPTPVTKDPETVEDEEKYDESKDEDKESDEEEEVEQPELDNAQAAQEAISGPEATRDDPLDESKEEELTDADKAQLEAPEQQGKFTAPTPRGTGTKVEKEVLSDADKELAASPELDGKFTAKEPETSVKVEKLTKEDMDDGKTKAKSPIEKTLPEASEKGFGFPRRNGLTGDIFNFDVPHTHVKFVDELTVPLSLKNYTEKTDYEIHQRLVQLGYVSEDGTRLT